MYVRPVPKPLFVVVLCQKEEEADRVSAQQIEEGSRLVFPLGDPRRGGIRLCNSAQLDEIATAIEEWWYLQAGLTA
jgi:hypothetical protein